MIWIGIPVHIVLEKGDVCMKKLRKPIRKVANSVSLYYPEHGGCSICCNR